MKPFNTHQKTITFFLLISAVTCTLFLMIFLPPLTQAAPPPRKPTPTSPPSKGDERSEQLVGAYIELHAPEAPPDGWTVVQWQDSTGNWHDVEGWKGTLDANGTKKWWVAPKDFGTGSFRWAIYQSQGGALLISSDLFFLPDSVNEVVTINL